MCCRVLHQRTTLGAQHPWKSIRTVRWPTASAPTIPIPDLPFVDDSHIPVDDPKGIEKISRHPGTDTWGRYDRVRDSDSGGWTAFTTNPVRHDLAWCVRWHPEHGRSVIVYRDEEISGVHMSYWGPALLFRRGAYWWDGNGWYRPAQVWDAAQEEYYRRPVPSSATVTAAADLLRTGKPDPAAARVLQVTDLDPDTAWSGRWLDHLSLWAAHRQDSDRSPGRAVVTLTAPELSADQMIGPAEVAEITGIAASTLRAYIARGESNVPLPQAAIGGRNAWARPGGRGMGRGTQPRSQRRRTGLSPSTATARPSRRAWTTCAAGTPERFYALLWQNPRQP